MTIQDEPRSHFSFNQLDNYLACPYKYYLGYEQELECPFIPSAVAFGNAIHSVLEGFHRSLIAGAPQSKEQLESLFVSEWKQQTRSERIRFSHRDGKEEMLSQGKSLLSEYHSQFHTIKPKAVELEFRLPMIRQDTGELGERDIVGKIDMVEEDNTPWEVKTGARALSQAQADSNMQITLYSWALTMLYGVHIGKAKVINLIRGKTPSIQVMETKRTFSDYLKLLKLLFSVNIAIEKEVFYPNPRNLYGCGNCPFSPQCEYAMI